VFQAIEKILYVKKAELLKHEFRLLLLLGLSADVLWEKVLPHYTYLKQRIEIMNQLSGKI